ncbi:TetR family transcriptional regulator [Gordonia sp. HNM0687]|uniref:TetR family transcriptional regulator n=1 Tax=Gordonia mangrovi TaxID=2665643 RepID=A0A6L7GNZ6_9ACTN|nr:TetR/AcrR family transcriptional regulator [Gordonia mangrovi]MXP21332.1 TetR family transcriptional regulator [Gordonia mangrovi]UVF80082.1 TetR/AcrR family transcriptional regulator [Gordonia mangrovi]
MSTEVDWTPKAREILAAASELFYEQGIHAVGVEAIAAHAGVTKRTLYDRFGSKEQLVVEYLRARDLAWRDLVTERLAQADGDPRARLHAIYGAARDWATDHSPKGCSMINAHAEISVPSHPAYPVIVGQKQWMRELFTQLATDATSPSPAALGERLLLIHEGAVVTNGMGVVADAFDVAEEVSAAVMSTG